MEVRLQVENNDTYVTGTTVRQPTHEGRVFFDDVVFGVLPGSSIPLRLYSDPPTTTIHLSLKIDSCHSDQELYERDDLYYCLDKEEPNSSAVILVYIGAGIILGISLVVLGLLFWKRREKPVHNATPSMCYIIVVGVMFTAASVIMWTKATDVTCALRGWLLALGLTMIFGAIFVRAYRLLTIFKRTVGNVDSVTGRILTTRDLVIGVALMLGAVIIVLVVWMAVAAPNQRDVIKIDVTGDIPDNTITPECDHSFPSSVFIIVLIVIEALLLAFDCVVAVLTRNLHSSFNESKHVTFTVRVSFYLIERLP